MTPPTRSDREILKRLGTMGLARILDDLLDQGRLVRLANACGLTYPGMRTLSQKRERILGDLVEKAIKEEPAWKVIHKALTKQTALAGRHWASLDPAEKVKRLRDAAFLARNGNLGLHLFLTASAAPAEEVEAELSRLLQDETGRPRRAAASPRAAEAGGREAARLTKKVNEIQKKVQYLEGQLARAREIEKLLKRDLLQRKGELAESRMLVERLRKEVDGARGGAAGGPQKPVEKSPDGGSALEELAKEVRRLAAEQRKLAHRLEKAGEKEAPSHAGVAEALAPVLKALSEVHKDGQALRRERRKDLEAQARRLDDVQASLKGLREMVDSKVPASRHRQRQKGEPPRVGVFIDVQNMYYSARQLKGKLDFDALLQAAVLDRRLILARAYVVESKEIDQSGFIAMLEQRGIEVRRKTVKVRADGSMKGDWDMEMALDILEAAPRLDVVVLVSGDGDFTSLVNRVKSMGPRVEVIAFPKNTAKSLVEAADNFHPLDRKYMIRTEAPPPKEEQKPAAPEPA